MYKLTCQCGAMIEVSAGEAGSEKVCACGQTLEVPALHVLKKSVGEAAASADLMVEMLGKSGKLPFETECARCRTATSGVAIVKLICETASIKTHTEELSISPLLLIFGIFGLKRKKTARVIGKDLAFDLPVRLCRSCAQETTVNQYREYLTRTKLYIDLLAKYPTATISTAYPL